MPVVLKTRIKWRGLVRAQMKTCVKRLESLELYNIKHISDPPFAPADVAQILAVINILQAAIARRDPVA